MCYVICTYDTTTLYSTPGQLFEIYNWPATKSHTANKNKHYYCPSPRLLYVQLFKPEFNLVVVNVDHWARIVIDCDSRH